MVPYLSPPTAMTRRPSGLKPAWKGVRLRGRFGPARCPGSARQSWTAPLSLAVRLRPAPCGGQGGRGVVGRGWGEGRGGAGGAALAPGGGAVGERQPDVPLVGFFLRGLRVLFSLRGLPPRALTLAPPLLGQCPVRFRSPQRRR